jgi:hypothetical protein
VAVGSPSGTGFRAGDWATITEIAWRRWHGEGIDAIEEAKGMAVDLYKGLMNSDLKLSTG